MSSQKKETELLHKYRPFWYGSISWWTFFFRYYEEVIGLHKVIYIRRTKCVFLILIYEVGKDIYSC